MKVGGQHFRTIWLHPTNERVVQLIDQRFLPHRFVIEEVSTVDQMATAIRDMHVRGAGLIGASAAYGMYLAAIEAGLSQTGSISVEEFNTYLANAAGRLKATRPTAVNLAWAIERVLACLASEGQKTGSRSTEGRTRRGEAPKTEKSEVARRAAEQIAD